jgi:hypothetical protein
MKDVSPRDMIRDPDWLPHTYDMAGQALTFVHVPRDARSALRFLFDEHFAGKFTKLSIPAASVAATVAAELESAERAPIHFIFHTSFCGSSLLARALEIPGVATSMREPAVLINLANRLIRDDNRANADRLELVVRLLERPFAPGEAVVAKQSNFANRVADPVLRARDRSRAVLLYSDLETFLISLLKRGMWGRILGRKLFNNLKSWTSLRLDLGADDVLELTDMQVAALAWLMHIHHFNDLAEAFGPRVMLLESGQMFAAPAEALHRVMSFFDLGMTAKEAADIASGPVFAKHSKFADRDYGVDERQRDLEAVGNANSEELSMVTEWVERFADHHGVALRPGQMPVSDLTATQRSKGLE